MMSAPRKTPHVEGVTDVSNDLSALGNSRDVVVEMIDSHQAY